MSVKQKQILKFPNQEQSPILKEASKEKFRILRPFEYELIIVTNRAAATTDLFTSVDQETSVR